MLSRRKDRLRLLLSNFSIPCEDASGGLRKANLIAAVRLHEEDDQSISRAQAMETPPPPQRVARPSDLPRCFMA